MTGIERQIIRKLLEDILAANEQHTVSIWANAEYLVEYSRDVEAILKALRFSRDAVIEVYHGDPPPFTGSIWIEFGYGTDVIRDYEIFQVGDLVAGAKKLAKELAEKLEANVTKEDTEILRHLQNAQSWIDTVHANLLLPRSAKRSINANCLEVATEQLKEAINALAGRLETPDTQQA